MSRTDIQKLVLEEFGNCLLKIIHAANNRSGKKSSFDVTVRGCTKALIGGGEVGGFNDVNSNKNFLD